MTPAERALWTRLQRRAVSLTPEMAAALLVAFAALRDGMSEAELTRLVQLGAIEQVLDRLISEVAIKVAAHPVRELMRRNIAQAFRYVAPEIPRPPATRALTIAFDVLNPRITDAVRQLETRVMRTLADSAREVVRAAVDVGLREGRSPKAIAAQIRGVVGLAPNQLQWVENYRAAVTRAHLSADALRYELRDKRFDGTVAAARAAKTPIPPEKVERMVDAMRRKAIASTAYTTARTAVLDSQKLGQRLTWIDAAEKGIVDRERLRKTWIGVMDSKERPEHVAMERETVGFDEPFSNGQMIPGDDEYNCRCLARYWLAVA